MGTVEQNEDDFEAPAIAEEDLSDDEIGEISGGGFGSQTQVRARFG